MVHLTAAASTTTADEEARGPAVGNDTGAAVTVVAAENAVIQHVSFFKISFIKFYSNFLPAAASYTTIAGGATRTSA